MARPGGAATRSAKASAWVGRRPGYDSLWARWASRPPPRTTRQRVSSTSSRGPARRAAAGTGQGRLRRTASRRIASPARPRETMTWMSWYSSGQKELGSMVSRLLQAVAAESAHRGARRIAGSIESASRSHRTMERGQEPVEDGRCRGGRILFRGQLQRPAGHHPGILEPAASTGQQGPDPDHGGVVGVVVVVAGGGEMAAEDGSPAVSGRSSHRWAWAAMVASWPGNEGSPTGGRGPDRPDPVGRCRRGPGRSGATPRPRHRGGRRGPTPTGPGSGLSPAAPAGLLAAAASSRRNQRTPSASRPERSRAPSDPV